MNLILLAQIRQAHLSQKAVARRARVTPATITAVIRGHVRPTAATIRKLCRGLRCQPRDLGFEDVPGGGR